MEGDSNCRTFILNGSIFDILFFLLLDEILVTDQQRNLHLNKPPRRCNVHPLLWIIKNVYSVLVQEVYML